MGSLVETSHVQARLRFVRRRRDERAQLRTLTYLPLGRPHVAYRWANWSRKTPPLLEEQLGGSRKMHPVVRLQRQAKRRRTAVSPAERRAAGRFRVWPRPAVMRVPLRVCHWLGEGWSRVVWPHLAVVTRVPLRV